MSRGSDTADLKDAKALLKDRQSLPSPL